MAEFRMPALGADMTEGTVTRWLVKPGDRVRRGDIVVEIETDKAAMEVEIFQAGVIGSLLVPEGERVAVGTPLALLETAEAEVAVVEPKPTPQVPPAPVPPLTVETVSPAVTPPTPVVEHPAPRATPTARALAGELGIDLARVKGTGVEGAVTRADVERAAGKPPAAAPGGCVSRPSPGDWRGSWASISQRSRDAARAERSPARTFEPAPFQPPARPPPPSPLRRRQKREAPTRAPIAALMERSNREIPHYYLELDIDLTRALKWLEQENVRRPVPERVLPSALLIKAAALACHDVPELNGHWVDGGFQAAHEVHLGVAISLRTGGVVAPAILDADQQVALGPDGRLAGPGGAGP